MAGMIDTPASEKSAHFIEMCDAFNIPLIFLIDAPGIMVGPDSERTGLVERSSKIHYAIAHSTVPVIGVLIRKSYGWGGALLGGNRSVQHSLILAWPTAEFGEMGLQGTVEIKYRKELAESKEPDKLRKELLQKFGDRMYAISQARPYSLCDIIDPRDTRPVLIKTLEFLKRRNPDLPPKKHGIHPI